MIENGTDIEVVSIDLGNSYGSWVKKKYPNAVITYDYFHVIKLINDRLNEQRNQTIKQLSKEDREMLNETRFLWLKNEDELTEYDQERLKLLRKTFKDLGDMSMMKESLRNIYRVCKN